MYNHLVIRGKVTDPSKVGDGMVEIPLLDEKAGRFVIKEAEDEDDTGEHNVNRRWDDPGIVRVLIDVQGRTPRSEIGQHDSDVHRTGKDAGAETTNRFWGNLRNVNRGDDSSLSNSKASDLSLLVEFHQQGRCK